MTASLATQTPLQTLPATIQRIILTGFMGAGKTTVGRLLAASLGWAFLDLDEHLEQRTGLPVAALFAQHGEAHFRRLESSALASALACRTTVIALGGGTPEQLTNRLLLEQTPGTVVLFLDASFPTLYDRCLLQQLANPAHQRPLLAVVAEAEARFQARQPLYRRLARHTLSAEDLTPQQSADALLELLSRSHP